METNRPTLSIIVPAYNSQGYLSECLSALIASSCPGSEIVVVDDASTDRTASVAGRTGARVLRLERNSGVAAARNYGAAQAQGKILFFVDADVVVAPGAVRRVMKTFEENPDLAALFGSYDASPRAEGLVSRYRNLLHHFVHQNGNPDASTFWGGCGAIRRSVFEEVGGFDEERFRVPSIEDIELGFRLKQRGHRILLDKGLQGTHLKKWTLGSVVRTDIFCRALPWSRLIVESKKLPNDLNLGWEQRASAALLGLAVAFLFFGVFGAAWLLASGVLFLAVVFLNRDLYGFFYRQGGLFFALGSILLHFLYYLYSTLSYLAVWAVYRLKSSWARVLGIFRRRPGPMKESAR